MGESIKHTHSVRMSFKTKISELWKLSPIEDRGSEMWLNGECISIIVPVTKYCPSFFPLPYTYILNTTSLEIWLTLLENCLHLSVFNNKTLVQKEATHSVHSENEPFKRMRIKTLDSVFSWKCHDCLLILYFFFFFLRCYAPCYDWKLKKLQVS